MIVLQRKSLVNYLIHFHTVQQLLSSARLKIQMLNFTVFFAETKLQHHEEINSLELMMKASQDTLRQMSIKHQQTVRNGFNSSKILVIIK